MAWETLAETAAALRKAAKVTVDGRLRIGADTWRKAWESDDWNDERLAAFSSGWHMGAATLRRSLRQSAGSSAEITVTPSRPDGGSDEHAEDDEHRIPFPPTS